MNALQWVKDEPGVELPLDVYCRTRDTAEARVARLRTDGERAGYSPDEAALLAAVAGELTANCFDHNLGTWRDIPGCWFAYWLGQETVNLTIADRGQGFLGSLRRVRPMLSRDGDALVLAFAEHVSGREPEQRGLGLAFVLDTLNTWPDSTIRVRTGTAELGERTPIVRQNLEGAVTEVAVNLRGTLVEVEVALPAVSR